MAPIESDELLLGCAISLDNLLIHKVFVLKTGEELSRWYTRMTPRIFGLKAAFTTTIDISHATQGIIMMLLGLSYA